MERTSKCQRTAAATGWAAVAMVKTAKGSAAAGTAAAAKGWAAEARARARSPPPPAPPPRLPPIHCHACTRRQTTASRRRPWLIATSCLGRRSGSIPPPPQRWSRGARPYWLRTCGSGRPRC
eukprot:scaffold48601_cov49-Phaeocystis_antarctica.AAC.1